MIPGLHQRIYSMPAGSADGHGSAGGSSGSVPAHPPATAEIMAQAPKESRILAAITSQFIEHQVSFVDAFGQDAVKQALEHLRSNLETDPEKAIRTALNMQGSLEAIKVKALRSCVNDIYKTHLLGSNISTENIFLGLERICPSETVLCKPILMLAEDHTALRQGDDYVHPGTDWLINNIGAFKDARYGTLALERSSDLDLSTWLRSENSDSIDHLYTDEVQALDEIRKELIQGLDEQSVPKDDYIREQLLLRFDVKIRDLKSYLLGLGSGHDQKQRFIGNRGDDSAEQRKEFAKQSSLVHKRWKKLAEAAAGEGLAIEFIDAPKAIRAKYKVINKLVRRFFTDLTREQGYDMEPSSSYFKIATVIGRIESRCRAERDKAIADNLTRISQNNKTLNKTLDKTLALLGAGHANGHLDSGDKSAYCLLKESRVPVGSVFLEHRFDNPNFEPLIQSYCNMDSVAQPLLVNLKESPLFDHFPFFGKNAYVGGKPPKDPPFDASLVIPS